MNQIQTERPDSRQASPSAPETITKIVSKDIVHEAGKHSQAIAEARRHAERILVLMNQVKIATNKAVCALTGSEEIFVADFEGERITIESWMRDGLRASWDDDAIQTLYGFIGATNVEQVYDGIEDFIRDAEEINAMRAQQN